MAVIRHLIVWHDATIALLLAVAAMTALAKRTAHLVR